MNNELYSILGWELADLDQSTKYRGHTVTMTLRGLVTITGPDGFEFKYETAGAGVSAWQVRSLRHYYEIAYSQYEDRRATRA